MTRSVIPNGSRVLLDTVAFVYVLEPHPRYGEAARAVLRRIESGEVHGLMASLVFAELLVPLYRTEDAETARRLVNLLCHFRHLDTRALSTEISVEAARLCARYGLGTPQAIHGATALIGQANGLVTNDRRLACLADEGLTVWLFDDLCRKVVE